VIIGEAQAQTVWAGIGTGNWKNDKHGSPIGSDKLVRPEVFEEIKNYSQPWADLGHGVKHVGFVGYLTNNYKTDLGRWTGGEIVKDCFEQYRLLSVAGIYLNYGHPLVKPMNDALNGVSIGSFLFNPIMPASDDLPRQIFAGKSLEFNVIIDNSSRFPVSGLLLAVRLEDFSKNILAKKTIPIADVSTNDNKSVPVDLAIPDNISGPAIVRLLVYRSNQMISQNYYYISVTPKVANQPVLTQKTLMVWKPSNHDISKTLRVFDTLKIKYELINTPDLQSRKVKCDWLCISAGSVFGQKENNEWKRLIGPITEQVKEGMNLLVLEQQGQGDLGIAPGMNYLSMPGNVTADPTMFDHPVLARVPWHKWWMWKGNHGDIAPFVMPVGMNSLAVIGAHADDRVYSIFSEGMIGKGRIILSQPDAVSRWTQDAAATLYLREL
jgi:hypothetical protein